MSKVHPDALSVRCPICGALPWARCKSMTEKKSQETSDGRPWASDGLWNHLGRLFEARDQRESA